MGKEFARQLTNTAASSVGASGWSGSLSDFSEHQNGGAGDLSTHQLLGILRNRVTVEIEAVYDAALAGDPEAAREYERKMTVLADIVKAWVALNPSHNS